MNSWAHRHLPVVMGSILALIMSLAFSGRALGSPLPSSSAESPRVPPCSYCGNDLFYGANQSWMSTAISKSAWPQKQGNWCGVANIIAINWYDQIKTFGTNVSPTWQTQQSISNLLNTQSAISPWGQATRVDSTHPAFVADIAADGGTDPRSIAWAAWEVTPNGFYFHNWDYDTSNTSAIYYFSSDFGPAHGLNDPISVTINEGAH